MWLQELAVAKQDAIPVLDTVWGLIGKLRGKSEGDIEADIESVRSLGESLVNKLHHHIHVPVALGSGASGEVEKASALAHALRIAAGSANLAQYLSEVRATCTDMGDELGLASLAVGVQDVLPVWMQRRADMTAGDDDSFRSE